MKKYLAIVAFMLAAAFPAAFATEPTQGKADQQTTNAPVQMSDSEMDKVVAGKTFQVCLDPFGCFSFNVPNQVLDFLHHQLQPQHHDHHHHH